MAQVPKVLSVQVAQLVEHASKHLPDPSTANPLPEHPALLAQVSSAVIAKPAALGSQFPSLRQTFPPKAYPVLQPVDVFKAEQVVAFASAQAVQAPLSTNFPSGHVQPAPLAPVHVKQLAGHAVSQFVS